MNLWGCPNPVVSLSYVSSKYIQNLSTLYHACGYPLGPRVVALFSYRQHCYGLLNGPLLPLLASSPIHLPTLQPNSYSGQSSQCDALKALVLLLPAPWLSSVGEKPESLRNAAPTTSPTSSTALLLLTLLLSHARQFSTSGSLHLQLSLLRRVFSWILASKSLLKCLLLGEAYSNSI